MLTDPRALEIISRARQPNVAQANRSTRDFDALFADFFAGWPDAGRFRGQRVLDLGPGQHLFARRLRDWGAEVEAIDNDPAVVELGAYLGLKVHDLNLRDFATAPFVRSFDGLFCKFALNAYWCDAPEQGRARVREIASILRPDGWGWIAPWNGLPKALADDLAAARAFELAQREAFLEAGWSVIDLTPEQARTYGMGGSVTGHPVFLRGVEWRPAT